MKIIRPVAISALISSNVPENDYAEYSAAATYAVGDRVIVAAEHKIYESLQASNTGHAPSTSVTWWLEVGATNRWRMFDDSLTAQTSNFDEITVVIQPASRIDSLALLNVDATTVQITMTDPLEGEVYDKSFSLSNTSGISDWYAYFFEPIERKYDLIVSGLPQYPNAELSISLANEGHAVLCGECVIGQQKVIGKTMQGASIGIQDYSVKQRDAFGNYTVLERSFNKRANFTVMVDAQFVDALQRLLAQYRAMPIVYIGTDSYTSTFIYGFYKDFSIEIAYLKHSICSLEVEGLT
jgi:hypothetical protein